MKIIVKKPSKPAELWNVTYDTLEYQKKYYQLCDCYKLDVNIDVGLFYNGNLSIGKEINIKERKYGCRFCGTVYFIGISKDGHPRGLSLDEQKLCSEWLSHNCQ